MNNLMKSCVLAAVVLGSAFSVCAEQIFNDANFLKKNKLVKFEEDGTAYVQGRALVRSNKFPVDMNKKYRLALAVQAPEGDVKSQIYFGYDVFDANGKNIQAHHVFQVAGTFTEVAADAKKGDDFLLVKDGSKFLKGAMVIVKDAKEDLSDLPNYKVVVRGINAVEQQGDNWKIILRSKLAQDLPAGSKIREQRMGGFLYAGGAKLVGNAWTNMGGTTTGSAAAFYGSKWPVGTATAQVVILADWTNKKVKTCLKDVSLTVE